MLTYTLTVILIMSWYIELLLLYRYTKSQNEYKVLISAGTKIRIYNFYEYVFITFLINNNIASSY